MFCNQLHSSAIAEWFKNKSNRNIYQQLNYSKLSLINLKQRSKKSGLSMTARRRMAGQSTIIFLPSCFDFKPSTMPLNYSSLIITWQKLIYIKHIARFPSILPIIKLQAANGNFPAMTILLTLTTPAYCAMAKVCIMPKRGFTEIVYFNDFLVIGATRE